MHRRAVASGCAPQSTTRAAIFSELLAKAINQGALDQSVTPEEKAKLLPFLKFYGDLDEQGKFTGTARSGFTTPAGARATYETPIKPVPLDTLLDNQQLPFTLFDDFIYMQATMFQPVGGMNQIAVSIERNLTNRAIRSAVVTRIRHSAKHVEVVYTDGVGTPHAVTGDYIVCTIPLPVLANIDTDFPAPYK